MKLDKNISRRDFMKLLGWAGITATVPMTMAPSAVTDYVGTGGKLFVMLHAGGGWDPSSLTDPKGNGNGINRFTNGDIISAVAGFNFAPNLVNAGSNTYDGSGTSLNRLFLNRFASRLLVINGVDMETNNHGVGPRYAWSGKIQEGHPTFNALLSAACAPNLPLSFITNGGYQNTAGLIASTRVTNTNQIEEISQPNLLNSQNIFTANTFNRIKSVRDARHTAKETDQRLPVIKNAMMSLTSARIGEADLNNFVTFFNSMTPFTGANVTNTYSSPESNRVVRIVNQFRVAWAAYQANICSSVNLNVGGFDTHSNHDAQHFPRLAAIVDALMHIDDIITATAGFTQSQAFFAVSSDFGRTPRYNGGNGKDHWPINSFMFIHDGGANLRTGTIGATDSDQRARKVLANTPTTVDDASGITIKPTHIQRAMRKYAGLITSGGEHALATQFGVGAEEGNMDTLISTAT